MFVVWLALLFAFLENKQLRMFTQKYDMQLKENIASKHNFLSANIKTVSNKYSGDPNSGLWYTGRE